MNLYITLPFPLQHNKTLFLRYFHMNHKTVVSVQTVRLTTEHDINYINLTRTAVLFCDYFGKEKDF